MVGVSFGHSCLGAGSAAFEPKAPSDESGMTAGEPRRLAAIGGTMRKGSSTERAMQVAAAAARDEGVEVITFDGEYIAHLPHYRGPEWTEEHGRELIEAVRSADALLIATPGIMERFRGW